MFKGWNKNGEQRHENTPRNFTQQRNSNKKHNEIYPVLLRMTVIWKLKKEILMNVWGSYPDPLLVWMETMETSTIIMKDRMEIPQRTEKGPTIDPVFHYWEFTQTKWNNRKGE